MTLAEAVSRITRALPEVVAVYRFGSSGSRHERSDSDIDLAVLGRSPFDPQMLWQLGQDLAAQLGRDVDLLDLSAASTVFRAQILDGGERLFCSDPAACDSYEAYLLSAYARLNEERKAILEDVLSRGSVHGR